MNDQIIALLEALEAIWFLTFQLHQHIQKLESLRANLNILTDADKIELLADLRKEVQAQRDYYGALLTGEEICAFVGFIRKQHGVIFVPKWYMDRQLFAHYDRVVPNWELERQSAALIFDGHSIDDMFLIYTLEQSTFSDVKYLLQRCRKIQGGVDDFRKRTPEQQGLLRTHLRCLSVAVFHFVEAYINGLAHNCLLLHHDSLSVNDHDTLAEWNSKKKKRAFIVFERKIFEYPKIVASAIGKVVDVSGFRAARLLVTKGKDLRDALTHPSPHIDPNTQTLKKLQFHLAITLRDVEEIWESAREYVITVEQGIGNDPKKTLPWFV